MRRWGLGAGLLAGLLLGCPSDDGDNDDSTSDEMLGGTGHSCDPPCCNDDVTVVIEGEDEVFVLDFWAGGATEPTRRFMCPTDEGCGVGQVSGIDGRGDLPTNVSVNGGPLQMLEGLSQGFCECGNCFPQSGTATVQADPTADTD